MFCHLVGMVGLTTSIFANLAKTLFSEHCGKPISLLGQLALGSDKEKNSTWHMQKWLK